MAQVDRDAPTEIDQSSHQYQEEVQEEEARPSLSRANQHLIAQTWWMLSLALALNSSVFPHIAFDIVQFAIPLTLLACLAFLNKDAPQATPAEPAAEEASSGSSASVHSGRSMRCCVICADAIQNDVVTLACGHCFDVNCLNDLFQAATRDESLYPPQCCFVPIPFDTAKTHLPSSTTSAYLDKEVEYKTHRRVYCAAPTCSRFIGSRDPDGTTPTIRACPSSGCKTRTCGRCTSGVLEGQRHACKVDRGERHALAVGRSHGWVRCPGCEEMVERSCGCFHMTCRCRTQFCYICRSIWKTCSCTRWTARVAAVRRQPMLVVLAVRKLFWTLGPPDTTQGLSRHAKCRHTDMTRRYVGRRCQDCNQAFVLGYHCPDCQTSVCSDCKLKLP